MTFTHKVSKTFDQSTQLILELCASEYLNLGFWGKKKISFAEAQLKLVEIFGTFSQLDKKSEIIDVGYGTGEQDLYYFNHYHCKSILGINTSEFQTEIALNKLKKAPGKYDCIQFELDDAMKLIQRAPQICNRVLALESAQMFDDKNTFFKGAFHVLKSGGYLCIAEPIPHRQFTCDKKPLHNLLQEVKISHTDHFQNDWLEIKTKSFLENMEKLIKSQLNWHLLYKDYLELLKKTGFKIRKIKDISQEVFGYFPSKNSAKEIIKYLKIEPKNYFQTELLWMMLISIYFYKYAFREKAIGYYLIKAEK